MEIAIAILICALLTLAVKKLSLPAIPAYIVAGLALGNAGLGIFEFDEIANVLSKMGIIFLLFYVGLMLKPKKMVEKKSEITVSGMIDLAVNFPLGFLIALAFGFNFIESFVIASALYISSSAIVLQSLIENRKLIFPEAETIVWLMVFEDLMLILLILIISAEVIEILAFFIKILGFACLVLVLVRLLSSFLSSVFYRTDEIPILLAFSLASLAIYISKVSEIPEAFAAIFLGLALSEIGELERLIQPFKDVFLVLFFFFFGVSVELGYTNPILVLALVLIAVLGKLLAGLALGKLIHKSTSSGIDIGTSTVARGEFSILIAALYGVGYVSSVITLLVIATSIIGSITAKYGYMLKFMRA
jgi:CPA2 family monovalent cation:H+ antiporter-2